MILYIIYKIWTAKNSDFVYWTGGTYHYLVGIIYYVRVISTTEIKMEYNIYMQIKPLNTECSVDLDNLRKSKHIIVFPQNNLILQVRYRRILLQAIYNYNLMWNIVI